MKKLHIRYWNAKREAMRRPTTRAPKWINNKTTANDSNQPFWQLLGCMSTVVWWSTNTLCSTTCQLFHSMSSSHQGSNFHQKWKPFPAALIQIDCRCLRHWNWHWHISPVKMKTIYNNFITMSVWGDNQCCVCQGFDPLAEMDNP